MFESLKIWEAYHKGVPLLGVPGITLEFSRSLEVDLLRPAPPEESEKAPSHCVSWIENHGVRQKLG